MKPLPRIEGEVQRYQLGPDGDEWVKADDYAALNDYAALVQMERDMARAELAENEGVIRVWRRRAETAEAEVERLRSQFANSERERKLLRAELSVTEDACAMLEADVERLRAALESIAENTCCGTCQEAALTDQSA